jgi:hypothetical protein
MNSRKIQRLEFVSDKIEGGIARGRSCAPVLVIPRRKMTLVRAPRGRAAMAGVGAPWEAKGELTGEGRERGRGRGGWLGGMGHRGEAKSGACLVRPCCCAEKFMTVAYVGVAREEEEKEEREKKKKRKRMKRKKKKKYEKKIERKIKDNL